jgi:hypothetical protein
MHEQLSRQLNDMREELISQKLKAQLDRNKDLYDGLYGKVKKVM